MSDVNAKKKFFRSVCMYYKTCSNRIDFDDDSECSSEAEQRKIKQEVLRNDRNTQTKSD
nr:MAG TPA: hypothetical protein [Inoviridae sp.]